MPHIHEKIDFTAEVFIVNGSRVFLRKHDKYKIWLSVGGHIELNEDPVQAVIREVKEETGLDIEIVGKVPQTGNEKDYKELIPPKFLNRHRINENHEHVSLVFFGKTKETEIVQNFEEKSDECRWFSMDELNDSSYGLRENVRFYAMKALEELGG
jgi:8-oxo-dGTP diphosphatase